MPAIPVSTTIRVPKAGEMVAAQLRRQIVTGTLKEGDALPSESVLMERYGVSRPTLREAFRILESERIIQVKRGARGGARVMLPDSGTAGRYVGTLLQFRNTPLADVYQARTNLETAAVAGLAQKRTAADIRELKKAVTEGELLLEDAAAFTEYDVRFHRLLLQLAGNQTVSVLLDVLFSMIESHNSKVLQRSRNTETSLAMCRSAQRAHIRLVELIRDKDASAAAAFWHQHLTQVADFMIADPGAGETVLDVLS